MKENIYTNINVNVNYFKNSSEKTSVNIYFLKTWKIFISFNSLIPFWEPHRHALPSMWGNFLANIMSFFTSSPIFLPFLRLTVLALERFLTLFWPCGGEVSDYLEDKTCVFLDGTGAGSWGRQGLTKHISIRGKWYALWHSEWPFGLVGNIILNCRKARSAFT